MEHLTIIFAGPYLLEQSILSPEKQFMKKFNLKNIQKRIVIIQSLEGIASQDTSKIERIILFKHD